MELSKKLCVDEIECKGKRVLVRVDYNVPLDKELNVTDTKRIEASLPTLNFLLENGARSIVLMSHLGRPGGCKVESMSLKPVVAALEKLLKRKVVFLPDCVGPEVEEACKEPADGTIIVLENLRFHIEEEGKNAKKEKANPEAVAKFRASLSKLGDIYVNDAFGTAHRAHSSMVGVNLETRAAGFLVKKELKAFGDALDAPTRPFTAILGGKKVTDKIKLIDFMLDKVDRMIIGGGMAYTFLKVLEDVKIGQSIYDEEGAKLVKQYMEKAKAKGVSIYLPCDWQCGTEFSEEAKAEVFTKEQGIPENQSGFDIGPVSTKAFLEAIMTSKTIIFNGPPGVFELSPFAEGTKAMLKAVADVTAKGAVTVIGGGDTAAAAKKFGVADKVSHISTGGGASLELLEGKVLPGLLALSNKA